MLKAVLLIFDPVATWDKIEKTPRSALVLFFTFALPLLLCTSAVESYGLIRLGHNYGISHKAKPVPQQIVIRYETIQFAFSLFILLGGAWMLKQIGEGAYRRHTFSQCFTTVAYSLSPLFLLRMLNAVPAINSWIAWGVGIILSIAALYRGIPRIMKPDPSNALGVYLTACITFVFVTGLSHLLSLLVLEEKILTGPWPVLG